MTDWIGVDVISLDGNPAGVIYGLFCECHPERGLRYVGQTRRTIEHRMSGHRTAARSGKKTPLYKWARKHGPGNLRHEILATLPVADLDDGERVWIASLRSRGLADLNVLEGGAGTPGYVATPEHRAKISEALRGRTFTISEEDRERRRKWGSVVSKLPGVREKITAARRARGPWKQPPHVGPQTSLRQRGEGNPCNKLSEASVGEAFRLYDEEGLSYKVVGEQLGVSPSAIHLAITGKTWAHLGLTSTTHSSRSKPRTSPS